MNPLFIFLFALFGEAIELLVYTIILKKKKSEITVKRMIIGFVVIFASISFFAGFYSINLNNAAVYRDILGKTSIVDSPGLKYQFVYFSTIEKYDLRATFMDYPRDIPNFKLNTLDEKVIQVRASLYYKIQNLSAYAVYNRNTDDQLYNYLTALVKEKITMHTETDLFENKEQYEKEIRDSVSVFAQQKGIQILNFKFTHLLESQEVIESQAYAVSNKIRSESDKQANELLQESLKNYTPAQLDYLRTKMLSSNPNLKWVVPNNGGVLINGE